MTLKKINPEQLKVGKKYLVEMEFSTLKKDKDEDFPLEFKDNVDDKMWLTLDQPIYTHEPPIEPTAELTEDMELQMLVSVASRIYTDPTFDDGIKEATIIAIDLINACKNALKEGER